VYPHDVTPARGTAGIAVADPGPRPLPAPAIAKDAPFQLRGNTFTMVLLKVVDPAHPRFLELLAEKVGQAPDFFRNAPVVLDVDGLAPGAELELPPFLRSLRELGLEAVSLQGGTPAQKERAVAAGLTLLAPRGERATAVAPPPAPPPAAVAVVEPPVAPPAPPPCATRIVTEPVRSGRQLYVPDGDLIVCAPVSAGAELAADGSIHVYGTLRGRAFAGASGDATARIFCQSLEAELVAVAGVYVVSEDMHPEVRRRPVQAYLDRESLRIVPITP
jgi:septum site-determining protein MinC